MKSITKDKRKVLILLQHFLPGGIEKVVSGIYDNINKEQFEVRFCVCTDTRENKDIYYTK